VVGNSLRIEPREKITDKHRAVIRQHKHSLLALLTAKPDAPDTRQEPSGAVLCADCKGSHGPDRCGHWWSGKSHHCISFKSRCANA
jgi:hypothetical protein